MGELSVYIKDDAGSRRKIWNKKDDQGSKWIPGKATISKVSTKKYQVDVVVSFNQIRFLKKIFPHLETISLEQVLLEFKVVQTSELLNTGTTVPWSSCVDVVPQ